MKNENKTLLLKTIVKVSTIMIFVSVVLKFCGLNYFNFDTENEIITGLSNFLLEFKLDNIAGYIFMIIDVFIMLSLSCKNDKNYKYLIGAILCATINTASQLFIFLESDYSLYSIVSFITFIVVASLINKKINIKKPLIVFGVILIYQMLSMILRSITFNEQFELVYDFLLNFDYMIFMVITYYLHLRKGVESKWIYLENYSVHNRSDGVSSYSVLKTKFLNLQKKLRLFSQGSRKDKVFVIIYLLLATAYELINILIILFVAFLNHSVIECLFILSSFLITKSVFGKPFHFDSAIKCFVVSNISYYILNRITFSVGISIIIPVSLGVGLSYIMSLFVKKKVETKIYRGMNREALEEICKEHNLDDFETNLLIDYYCHKMSLVKLAIKNNYSKDSIWKKKRSILMKVNGK